MARPPPCNLHTLYLTVNTFNCIIFYFKGKVVSTWDYHLNQIRSDPDKLGTRCITLRG